jgi:hypothetical protein
MELKTLVDTDEDFDHTNNVIKESDDFLPYPNRVVSSSISLRKSAHVVFIVYATQCHVQSSPLSQF